MKKLIVLICLIVSSNVLFGQVTRPKADKKEFKNIVGIDATGLLNQFLNLNQSSSLCQFARL